MTKLNSNASNLATENVKCALVIPCFNEEFRLPQADILKFAQSNPNYDLFLIDDGSRDKTWQKILNLQEQNSQINGFQLPRNQGKAEAVRQGVLFALAKNKYQFLGYFDADLSSPLDEALAMQNLLFKQSELDLILGSRLKKLGNQIERNLLRHLLGRMFATAVSLMLGLPVYDTQCGAKLFRSNIAAELFDRPFVSPWFFDVELIARHLAAKQNPTKIFEMPLSQWTHQPGSKLTAFDYLKVPVELFKIYRSLKF